MQASAGHPPVGGRVLVGYATRMGSTAEIAEAIGEELRAQGHIVLVSNCQTAPPPTEFDAVILGSPIYLRGWDKSVVSYLRTHVRDLAERPTWLFHSGPCGPGAETEQVDPPRQV